MNRRIKRGFSEKRMTNYFVVLSILLILFSPVFGVLAQEDTQAPIVESISFLGSSTTPIIPVTIQAHITDDLSGVATASYWIINSLGENLGQTVLIYNSGTGFWERTFTPDQYAPTGTYYIYRVYVKDNSGNWADYYYNLGDPNTASVEVTGTTPDTEAPEVESIIFDGETTSPTDPVTIQAELSDIPAGVATASYWIINSIGVNLGQTVLIYNSGTGFWERTFTPDQYAPLGTYYIYRLYVKDKAGNWANYYYNLGNPDTATVEVTGTTPDTEAPVVESITFDKPTVIRTNPVKIQADLSDTPAGVATASYWIINSIGVNLGQTVLIYNSGTGFWERTFTPDQYAPLGTYYIYRLYVKDKAGNWANYYYNLGDPDTATVEVVENTPQKRAELLIDEVEGLVEEGILNDGQAGSLIDKLEKAITEMDNGDEHKAIKKLTTFISIVTDLMNAGILPQEEGQSLIDQANAIIQQLSI